MQKSKSLGRCTLAEAKAQRDELAVSIRRGEFVQPSKQTLAEWLNVRLDESVRSARRGNTVLSYQSLIANHIISGARRRPVAGIEIRTFEQV